MIGAVAETNPVWKKIRIGVLLVVLAIVATNAWLERRRSVSWRDSLYVAIVPVAADDSATTRRLISELRPESFQPLEAFFAREARRYGLALDEPFRVELHPPVEALPPPAPDEPSPWSTMLWSLRMRWYAAHAGSMAGQPAAHVRMFVLYHDPLRNAELPHSVGLQKGRIGLVHAFASATMAGANLIVIAHELLHTVGATDKYDASSNAPRYPEGFADPGQQPRFPQLRAEIMAGRRALSDTQFEMPEDLDDCVVGATTAIEIGWTPR